MSGDGTTDRGAKPPRTLFSLGRPGPKGATTEPPIDPSIDPGEPVAGDLDDAVASAGAVELACGACGETLIPGAAFCGECGTPVALDDEPFDLVEEVPMADLDAAELGEYVEELAIDDASGVLYADAPPTRDGSRPTVVPAADASTDPASEGGDDESGGSAAAVLAQPAAVLYADPTSTEPLPAPTGTFAIAQPTFGSADSAIGDAETTDDEGTEPDHLDDVAADADHDGATGAVAGVVAGAALAGEGSLDEGSVDPVSTAVETPEGHADADAAPELVDADVDADAELVDADVDAVDAGPQPADGPIEAGVAASGVAGADALDDAEPAGAVGPEPSSSPSTDAPTATEPMVAPAATAAGAGAGAAVGAGSYDASPPPGSSSRTGLLVGVAAAVVLVLVVAGVLIASGGDKEGSLETAQQPTTTTTTMASTTSTTQASSTTGAPASTDGPTTTADTTPVESTAPTTVAPVVTAAPTTPRPTVPPTTPAPTAPPTGRITSNPAPGGEIIINKGGTAYITLQNVGGAAAGCALTGSAGLTVSQNCSPSIPPGATVVVSVTVSPTKEGPATVTGVLEGAGSYYLVVNVPNG